MPIQGLNAVLPLVHPLDRFRNPSTIGSAIGRPCLALSRIHTQVEVLNRLVLDNLGSSTARLWCSSVENLGGSPKAGFQAPSSRGFALPWWAFRIFFIFVLLGGGPGGEGGVRATGKGGWRFFLLKIPGGGGGEGGGGEGAGSRGLLGIWGGG